MATRYRWDDFVLDLDAYRLERAGTGLSLEPKAFNLLALMVCRPGHLFTKQEIFDAVWPNVAVTDHALTRVVAQLRRVLGDEAREARYLETVPTRGYRWIRPVEAVAPSPAEAAAPPIPATPPVVAADAQPAATDEPRITVRSPPTLSAGLVATTLLAVAVITIVAWTQRGDSTAQAVSAPAASPSLPDKGSAMTSWPVQVTTHPGLDMHPALSPQGDAIAFVSDRSGALEIYVRALEGPAADIPLTRDGAQNVQPAWSPDGRFLAYHSYLHGGVWVMPARGGPSRQVVPTGSKPAWSPDGQHIAFQSDEQADVSPDGFGAQSGSTIWQVRADGHDLRQLTRSGAPPGGHAAPSWNADGRHVAFSVFDAGPENGVWVLDVKTGETSPLDRGYNVYESAFAPDGSTLFVAGGVPYIAAIPFDPASGTRSGQRTLIPVPGATGVRGMTISPDGRTIGFAGVVLSSQIWAQPVARDGRPSGSAVALTDDTSRRNSFPSISPDGTRVAYMSSRRGELPNVWVMGIDGGDAVQMTSDETGDYQPRWMRDGRRIAYVSDRNRSKAIWIVDVVTRRETLLVDVSAARGSAGAAMARGRLGEVALSPATMTAAFSFMAAPSGRRVLYVSGTNPFAPRALTDGRLSVGYPAWAPDERAIAVEVKDERGTHAAVVDVASGTLRPLTEERGQTWVRSWSPDGRRIAVAAMREGTWSLRAIDVTSGRQETIVPPTPPRIYLRYPEWSPRGDVILFERAEMRGNIWQLKIG